MVILTVDLAPGTSWTLPAATAAAASLHRSLYLYAGGSASIDGSAVTGRP